MKKLIMLLLVCNLLSLNAYTQDTTSVDLRRVNKDLLYGLKGWNLLDIERTKVKLTDSALAVMDSAVVSLQQALILQKKSNTELLIENANINQNAVSWNTKYNKENKRKRRWRKAGIVATLVAVGEAVLIYVLVKP